MSDDTTLADLLQLNLHKYEDEVRNIVDKAVKESGMEKVPRPRAPRGSSGATRSRHAAARASRYTRVFSSPPVTGTSEFTTKKKKNGSPAPGAVLRPCVPAHGGARMSGSRSPPSGRARARGGHRGAGGRRTPGAPSAARTSPLSQLRDRIFTFWLPFSFRLFV